MAEYTELIKSLRQCSYGDCIGCKNEQIQKGCRSKLEIEAADAIKELKQITNHYKEESKGWWLAACDSKEEIEKLRDATPKWIPVSEQLPPLDEDVLVLAYGSMKRIWMLEKPYSADAYWECEDGFWEDISAATHWMPLPEPPKDGDSVG